MHRFVVFGSDFLAALFIVGVGAQLPDVVASHFNASGKPDGFLPRTPFVILMVVIAGGLPPLTWWLQVRQARNSSAKIGNASFWFAPERHAATVRWLSGHAATFSAATAAFISYVFWLVYLANSSLGTLPALPFFSGLAVYLVFAVLWVLAMKRRFRTAGGA